MQDKFRMKQFGYVHLEKAFGRKPREVIKDRQEQLLEQFMVTVTVLK